MEHAKVPCIQTGTRICHIYVDAAADQEMALSVIENAKTSRPSVCNAAEVLLIHQAIAAEFLPRLRGRLTEERSAKGLPPVELRLDKRAAAIIPGVPAGERDFDAKTPRPRPDGTGRTERLQIRHSRKRTDQVKRLPVQKRIVFSLSNRLFFA